MSTARIPWETLISAREAAGVSRYRLAQDMGINLSHLGRLERGEASPRVDTIRRAAQALGVPVEQVTPAKADAALVLTVEQLREVLREELTAARATVEEGDLEAPSKLWGVYLNTDMTEGRGMRYLARLFRTELQARRWVETQHDYPGHPMHVVAAVDFDLAALDAPEGLRVPR